MKRMQDAPDRCPHSYNGMHLGVKLYRRCGFLWLRKEVFMACIDCNRRVTAGSRWE